MPKFYPPSFLATAWDHQNQPIRFVSLRTATGSDLRTAIKNASPEEYSVLMDLARVFVARGGRSESTVGDILRLPEAQISRFKHSRYIPNADNLLDVAWAKRHG